MGTEVAAPALRLYAGWRTGRPATDPAEWRRVVIFGSAHIGDVLYRTASLPHLRRALPTAHIAYVCAPLTAEILETDPNVDEVLPLVTADRVWRRSSVARTTLRGHAFDAALCTDHIDYGGDLRLAAEIGIPNRVGFIHKGWSGLVTLPIRPAGPQPIPAFFRDMVVRLGGQPATWDLTPRVTVTREDRARAETIWRELAIPAARYVVACAVSWRQPNPIWPRASFMAALEELARLLGPASPLDVVLCGSAAEAPVLEAAARGSSLRCHVLAGRLNLPGVTAFLAGCSAFLGPDSGLRHLANAVGTPVVFVRNLGVASGETGVYCANETDVAPPGDYMSVAAQVAALATIEPRTVAATLYHVLRPGPEVRQDFA
jgi:ADP-heptose:LPS heptosyltransferase